MEVLWRSFQLSEARDEVAGALIASVFGFQEDLAIALDDDGVVRLDVHRAPFRKDGGNASEGRCSAFRALPGPKQGLMPCMGER